MPPILRYRHPSGVCYRHPSGVWGPPQRGPFIITTSRDSATSLLYKLHALNKDGEEIWTAPLHGHNPAGMSYNKGLQRCFVATTEIGVGTVRLRSFLLNDGSEEWSTVQSLSPLDLSSSSEDNLVYGFIGYKLTAFSTVDGTQVWQNPLVFSTSNIYSIAAVPGFVYVCGIAATGGGGSNEVLHQFDATGTRIWSAYSTASDRPTQIDTASDGALFATMFYSSTNQGSLARLSDVDGSLVWESTRISSFTTAVGLLSSNASSNMVYAWSSGRVVKAEHDGNIIRDATPGSAAYTTGLSDVFRPASTTIQRVTIDASSITVVWTWTVTTDYPGHVIVIPTAGEQALSQAASLI